MQLTDRHTREDGATDDGFTLVEVTVALALLGVIATATLGFFISGTRTSTDLQRRQVAVALANAAVEDARGLPVTVQTSTTGGTTTTWPLLVRGRTQSSVSSQWSASGSPASTTFPAWDPSSPVGALLVAPTKTDRVGTASYTTTTYIGTCYRLRATTSQPCDRAGGERANQPPAGYEELVRISATTAWGTAQECSGSACSYTASVLVDTSVDPEWNTSGGRAVDDTATVARGTRQTLDVLNNDTMIPARTSPVTVRSAPSGMRATADPAGTITLEVPADAALGSVTVTYFVKDAYGATSNTATVRVTVTR